MLAQCAVAMKFPVPGSQGSGIRKRQLHRRRRRLSPSDEKDADGTVPTETKFAHECPSGRHLHVTATGMHHVADPNFAGPKKRAKHPPIKTHIAIRHPHEEGAELQSMFRCAEWTGEFIWNGEKDHLDDIRMIKHKIIQVEDLPGIEHKWRYEVKKGVETKDIRMREVVYWLNPASESAWIVPPRHCFKVKGIQCGYGCPQIDMADVEIYNDEAWIEYKPGDGDEKIQNVRNKISAGEHDTTKFRLVIPSESREQSDSHAANILLPNIDKRRLRTLSEKYGKEETKFVCDQFYTFAKYHSKLQTPKEGEFIHNRFTQFREGERMVLCEKKEVVPGTVIPNRRFYVRVIEEGHPDEGNEKEVHELDFPGSMNTYLSKMKYHEIPDSRFRITRWWERVEGNDDIVKIHIEKEKMTPIKDDGKIVNWKPIEADGFPMKLSIDHELVECVEAAKQAAIDKKLEEYYAELDAKKAGDGDHNPGFCCFM